MTYRLRKIAGDDTNWETRWAVQSQPNIANDQSWVYLAEPDGEILSFANSDRAIKYAREHGATLVEYHT